MENNEQITKVWSLKRYINVSERSYYPQKLFISEEGVFSSKSEAEKNISLLVERSDSDVAGKTAMYRLSECTLNKPETESEIFVYLSDGTFNGSLKDLLNDTHISKYQNDNRVIFYFNDEIRYGFINNIIDKYTYSINEKYDSRNYTIPESDIISRIQYDTILIYIHGFASDGNAQKGKAIRNAFQNDQTVTVITPSFSPHPEEALKQLEDLVIEYNTQFQRLILIGSSLGGFYADYFKIIKNVPVLLINPLVAPEDIEKFIGINTNLKTGEEFNFTNDDFAKLLEKREIKNKTHDSVAPRYILLAENDELLDYRKTLDHYSNTSTQIRRYTDGGHRFENNEALILAIQDLIQDYENI